jgi:hypothetical protein
VVLHDPKHLILGADAKGGVVGWEDFAWVHKRLT